MIVRPASRMLSAISFGVFWRSAPSTRLDHAVEEGLAWIGRDSHDDLVGENARAAGDGRAVAAGFANHGRGFTGDGGLVDRGDTFDDFAVAWNEFARDNLDAVVDAQLRAGHLFEAFRRS